MPHMLIFGPGYTASRLAAALEAEGWRVTRADRAMMADRNAMLAAIAAADHILSSVPPAGGGDPVLARYGPALAGTRLDWLGYLSSTGIHGDTGGAWVDEGAPAAAPRRAARAAADAAWLTLHPQARVFRLPGIYGPGRSALDRVAAGKAHRIDLPDQVFSRVHVDDIVAGVCASLRAGPPGAYNLADDLPAPQNAVVEAACDLLGRPWPPLETLDAAALSPAARGFYAENRRVANGKAKRLLGWAPLYPDYRAGLRALMAISSPASESAQPSAACQPHT